MLYYAIRFLRTKIIHILLSITVAVASLSCAYGQTQCLKSFEVSLGGNNLDLAYDVADAGGGNFFVAGTTTSYGAGGTDIMVSKMSASGTPLWTKVYGAAGNETVRKANSTPDGGLVLTGQTTSFSYSQGEIFCMKIDASGNLLWSRHFGLNTEYGDLGLNIIQTSDGGFAVVGLYNIGGVVADLAIGRLDANGNIIWFKRLDSGQAEDGTGILQEGNELIVTTDLDNLGVDYSFLIMRLNLSDGSIISQIQYVPAERGFFGPFLFKDINNNGYWLSGQTVDGYGYNGLTVPTIIKMDNNLNITNTYSYKADNVYTNDFYDGFAQVNGGFVVCASTTTTPKTGYLYNINNDASVKWGKMFNGPADRSIYRVGHIGTNIITVGADNSSGNDDFFIAGFNDGGFIDPLCNPDTALVSVTAPSYGTEPFAWKLNEYVTFPNIVANLSLASPSPTYKSLCNACPVVAPTPAFTIPDTVCVNTPVKITNTSVAATSYYWSFCTANINQPPTGTNLGDIGNALGVPVFIDYANVNGNYYGFMVNNSPGGLLRLDFGNSLLNTPTVTNLGNFGGVIPNSAQGIKLVENNDDWVAIIVGGDPTIGVASRVLKIDFGTNITNNTPAATNWGNVGNLNYPTGLFVFQDGANWYGFTTNYYGNNVTEFSFGAGFSSTPSGTNLGNLGNLSNPSGLFSIDDNGTWRLFVSNFGGNSLTRIDFGNGLLSVPTNAVNLGNVGGLLNTPRDVYIFNYCSQIVGFSINDNTGDIIQLNFSSLTAVPTGVSLGNLGGATNPHSISKISRQGSDLVGFLPNSYTNTLSRLVFQGCTNSSIPNSTAQTPPSVTYSTPGTYNIDLDIDDGLPTQSSVCHPIVVLGDPAIKLNNDTAICAGQTIRLTASGAFSYQWLPSTGLSNVSDSIVLATPTATTTYYVTAANSFGCSAKDSVKLNVLPQPTVKSIADTSICIGQTVQLITAATNGSKYSWSPSSGLSNPAILSPVASPLTNTSYVITVDSGMQCYARDTVNVYVLPLPTITTIEDTTICAGQTIQLTTATNGSTYSWSPSSGLSNPTVLSPFATPLTNTSYIITVNPGTQCNARDTINIHVSPLPIISTIADTSICSGETIQLTTVATNGSTYSWSPSSGLSDPTVLSPFATPLATISYIITVESGTQCYAKDTINVHVSPLPTINTISDTTIILCKYSTVRLSTTVTNTTVYNWSPSLGLSDSTALSPLASPLTDTKYIITAGVGNCSAKDSVSISVIPSPIVKAFGDTSICSGSSAQLSSSASPNVTYNWAPSYGLNNSTIANPLAQPTSSTIYVVQVKYSDDCTARDSVNINVLPQPTISTIADTTICSGQSVELVTNSTNTNTYSWYPSTGLSDPAEANPIASPSSAITYVVVANSGTLCFASDTVNVNVNPAPKISLSQDTLICLGGSANISATSSLSVSYNWSPSTGLNNSSIANPVASPASTTTYYLVVKTATNCTATDSVNITVNPAPVFAITPGKVSICAGDTATLSASGGDIYAWYPSTNITDTSMPAVTVSPLSSVTYYVVITNSTCHVIDTLSSQVDASATFNVSVTKSNDVDCTEGEATLHVTGGTQYTWFPLTGISNPASANPVVSPLQTTTYYVEASNGATCTAKDSITVIVSTADANNGYLVASAFTPNGDGVNDCFGVKFWGGIKTIDFSVYNRWGERIFHSNNQSDCWDGTYKGQLQPTGTFVYQITASTICGNVYRKGTVVLIR